MEGLYPWVVFIHVLGAFTFVLAHGTSATVVLRLRRERELERVRALLDLSQISTGAMYAGLVVLVLGGIAAAFIAGLWGRGWIWAAIALLVLMIVFMYVRAVPYFGSLRRASGLPYFLGGPHEPEPVDSAALARLLSDSRPMELTVVGSAGLVLIIWLMLLKPF
jgi:hypothetical protein